MLKDKVIVVTGAGRGIGRAIALSAASYGARVVVNDLGVSLGGEGEDTGPARETVEVIKAAGGEAVANTNNVAEWDGARGVIETAISSYGRLDGVVNNAGILRDRMFHKMHPDEWDAVIKVNLYGGFYISRAAAPYFKEQGSGAYVHMSSSSGLIGNLGQGNYAAAKMGIVALSKQIALDMERFSVRSNVIAPSAFGRMTETIQGDTPEQQARIKRRRETMRPEQVAQLAIFLLSEAAGDVNAQIFGVRGNEVYLYSQPRPIRTIHRGEGWTPETLAEYVPGAWSSAFTPLERARDVISWEPI